MTVALINVHMLTPKYLRLHASHWGHRNYPRVEIMMDFWIFVKSENFTKFRFAKMFVCSSCPSILIPISFASLSYISCHVLIVLSCMFFFVRLSLS
jgi:hypothetical protein